MAGLRRIVVFLAPRARLLLLGLALVQVSAALSLVTPLIVQRLVDAVVAPHGSASVLALGAGAIVAVTVLRGVFTYYQRKAVELAAQRAMYDLRNRLYRHLHELSFSFYDRAQTGQLMSRLVSDVETLRHFLGMGIVNLTSNLLQVIGIVAVLVWLDWRLTLAALSTLPLILWMVRRMSRQVRPATQEVQQQLAVVTATLQENLAGMRVVQAFGRWDQETDKFTRENQLYLDKSLSAARISSYYMPLITFLSYLSLALILWYGGLRVMAGELSVGELVAFNSYVLMMMQPMRVLGSLINLGIKAGAAGERLVEILDAKPAVQDRPGAIDLPAPAGSVRFEGVHFHYPGAGRAALYDINLEVQPGQRVAVVGPTGSGKSSLIQLIPRFYDVTAGRLLVDGYDVRDVTLASLRRRVGVVLQDTFLFSATVRENIAYGRAEATLEEVVEAAQAAQLHDFILSLPQGYDTLVGERGVNLSGGQKQRVAIARALLLNTPIVILDESTSAVDAETEHLIRQALDRLMQGRTCFIVAQRLATVHSADLIVVLDGGRIVQRGTHQQLLAQDGLYRRIYDLQFRPELQGPELQEVAR